MKLSSVLTLSVALFVSGNLYAGSLTAVSQQGAGSNKDTVIQNSEIKTDAQTKAIDASGNSKVGVATVDINKGVTIQNSKINAKSDTGSIKTTGHAEVNAGGVTIK